MTRSGSYHHGDLPSKALEAALAIVDEAGEGALSLRAIAQRVGVAHRALYNHFRDREDLLCAIAAAGFAKLSAGVNEAEGEAEFLRQYVRFALDRPGLYGIMMSRNYAAIGQRPELRRAVDELISRALLAFAPDGGLENARRRAVMRVWMLAHGGISLQRAGILRTRSDPEFIAEIMQIAGFTDDRPRWDASSPGQIEEPT